MDTFECGHDLPAKQTRDPLEQAIYDSISGVQKLRSQVKRLEAELEMSRGEASTLRIENEALRVMLQSERDERAYYHRFAIEVTTSLNLVGQVVDEVMQKAQGEAFRRQEDGNGRCELPELRIPAFLRGQEDPAAEPEPRPFGAPAGRTETRRQ